MKRFRSPIVALKDSTAPEWIEIMYTGTFKTYDFEITPEMLTQFVDNFNSSELDVVIDYEHLTLADDSDIKPGDTIAAGWIDQIEIRGESLWAHVKSWTESARDYIESGEYRYLSPAFQVAAFDKQTGDPIGARLLSVAITNTPYLEGLSPLSLKQKHEAEMTMDELMQLLGLAPGASADEVSAAVKELRDKMDRISTLLWTELMLRDDASVEDAVQAVQALKARVAAPEVLKTLGLSEDATIKDFVALKAKGDLQPEPSEVEKLKAELEEMKQIRKQEQADSLVAKFVDAGKITPDQAKKESLRKWALGDPAGFEDYFKSAPAVVLTERIVKPGVTETGQHQNTVKGDIPDGMQFSEEALRGLGLKLDGDKLVQII